ncbi:MAG: hypothetical protein J6A30_09405 [Ruminococcus sp.]|nr:hypothetical protein [Ruminococcus sp.]
MITENDLRAAIAECQGERNPNANTCMKLAAYYTILNNLYPEIDKIEMPSYSASPAPASPVKETVEYYSDTEFATAIEGKNTASAWAVIDELMTVLQAIKPGLYEGVLRKLREI